MVNELPGQIVPPAALMAVDPVTVTVFTDVFWQPLASVPVIEYEVVVEGDTEMVDVVAAVFQV